MSIPEEATQLANDYVDFLNKSKSPWHVIASLVSMLQDVGFTELNLDNEWNLQPNGKYFITKGGSTLLAFGLGGNWTRSSPIAFVAPHSDSPSLRIKPVSNRGNLGYVEVGAAQYGGGLWHTWFDKDLGLAGRAFVRDGQQIVTKLLHVDRAVGIIPSLAIHFDSNMNVSFTFDHENNLLPIIGLSNVETPPTAQHQPLLMQLLAKELNCQPADIVEFDINLIDITPARIGGANNELIFAQNQDNQISSFACMKALIDSVQSADFGKASCIYLYGTYDNEEVGNVSDVGASTDFTMQVLTKITTPEYFAASMNNSFALSADVDHAVNPNYTNYYEVNSRPSIDGGPIIKYNYRLEMATTGFSAAFVREIGSMCGVQLQSTVPMNGKRTGSTHGPSLCASLGIPTADLGPPLLAMHSTREISGVLGLWYMKKFTEGFWKYYDTVMQKFRPSSKISRMVLSGKENKEDKNVSGSQ